MKRFFFILAALALAVQIRAGELEKNFAAPPDATKPWCYWYWISDNISKDGITRDLEAMARVGIGEAFIGNVVDPDTPLGTVKIFSDEWWSLVEHAIREGKRTGVNIGVFNGPGWSQSGGPWITPKDAMRYVVSSETRGTGPVKFSGKLAVPKEPFQDIAVLAYPAPRGDAEKISAHSPRVTCDPPLEKPELLVDGDVATGCVFPMNPAGKCVPFTVNIELKEPFTARSLALSQLSGSFSAKCELLAADEKGGFRIVREFVMDRRGLSRPQYSVNVGPMIHGDVVVSFPAVSARVFRLRVTPTGVESAAAASSTKSSTEEKPGLAEINLSGAARLDCVVEKQLGKMFPTPAPVWDSYLWPTSPEPESADLNVAPKTIQNLSGKLGADGTLHWDVPAGEWVIQRIGMTLTGAHNHPTTDEGRGLECDKMNRAAIEKHFDSFMGKLVARMPKADRSALHHVVIDSFEVGSENWTDGFGELFRKTFGYDPTPWLPVLSGRIVGSADQSDRFLWDLRRLVADRIARDYVGGLRDVANKHGLRLWLENYGHWGFPAEFIQYGSETDDVAGEFWVRGEGASPALGSVELRDASSAAHLYGKREVFAESFTSARSFQDFPGGIKTLGDWAFCQGINHSLLHVYIHQPWQDRKPGVNAWFGTEFNRNNTWFEQSKAWIDYLRRCHLLLQQGHSVAEVAYFIGDDAPKMTGIRQPALPSGYDYDYINAEALINRAQAKDGKLVIPDGPSYSLLVLPPQETMRPEMLRKIRDLVAQGVAVLGQPPRRSPSLKNFPKCDDEVKKLAAEVWGDLAKPESGGFAERAFGKGRVFQGNDLAEALRRVKTAPAIQCPSSILWTHRQSDDAEIFFLSNQKSQPVATEISFRVAGRMPEFWHADTGATEASAWFTPDGDRTRVPVSLDAGGSMFVVFRKKADAPSVTRIDKDGKALEALDAISLTANSGGIAATVTQPGRYTLVGADGKERVVDATALSAPVALDGAWRLKLSDTKQMELPQLISWPESSDDVLKYFSGTATYEKEFQLPAEMLGSGKRVTLDLGRVEVLAEVRVNGKSLGVLWKKPFAVDITDAVKPGANTIEVKVTNNWFNRLVGDDKLPVNERTTFTTASPRSPRTKLLPSGLIGPVMLRSVEKINVR